MKVHGIITSFEGGQAIIGSIRERRIPAVVGLAPYRQEYYRGQLSDKWNLKSSISRLATTAEEIKALEQKLMASFKDRMKETKQLDKLLIHENPDAYQNEWSLLSQAQHIGIPTRLMDWTLSAEVGLYFAVDDPKFDDQDGQYWVIYVPQEKILIDGKPYKGYNKSTVADIEETIFINPSFYQMGDDRQALGEVRRARQHGKFSMQSYENCLVGMDQQSEFQQDYYQYPGTVIEKYIIPAEFKAQLRLDLISRGYTGEFLSGNDDADINAVRDYCKFLVGK